MLPMRLAGIAFKISSIGRFLSFVSSVSISPGATTLTVILRLANSTARAFEAPINPAFEAL